MPRKAARKEPERAAGFEASQYALRASFYYRANHVWPAMRDAARESRGGNLRGYNSRIGVSERALERIRALKTPPHWVFAQTRPLVTNPRLISYYRNLALVPQKGLQRLAFSTSSLETGRGRLNEDRALTLVKVLNGLISMQIESDPEWNLERAEMAAILNVGSQINGSWRNAIGEEGSRQIKVLLASSLVDRRVIDRIELVNGQEVRPPIHTLEAASSVRRIHVTNGYAVTFAPEPDVSFRDEHGTLVGTIEVKYGSDSAGALERYGAVRKSFEAAVRENARVQNVYVANALTAEVRRRIQQDRLVSEVYEFTRISVDQEERARFLRFVIRRLLDL